MYAAIAFKSVYAGPVKNDGYFLEVWWMNARFNRVD